VPAVAIATIALASGLDTLPENLKRLNARQVINASFLSHRNMYWFLKHIPASAASRERLVRLVRHGAAQEPGDR
jgi:hypothetical protein